MEDYISREKALGIVCKHCDKPDDKDLCPYKFTGCHLYYDMFDFPAADVVSRDCYNRILEENDTMRKQLAMVGKKPGDKMDNVWTVDHGKWEEVTVDYIADVFDGSDPMMSSMRCNKCDRYYNRVYSYGDPKHLANYCPHCGAKMDLEKGI